MPLHQKRVAAAAHNIANDGPRCPRCGAPDAALNLLTSMIRYFLCRECAWRWQIAVVQTDQHTYGVW